MNDLRIHIAGLTIGIKSEISEFLTNKCSDYIIHSEPDFFISENRRVTEQLEADGLCHEEAVFRSIFNEIADALPSYHGFVTHSVSIKLQDKALLITGDKGAGKTTISKQLISYIAKEACIINGDKTIIRIINGAFISFGSPWCGKEGINMNDSAPINSIVYIAQGDITERTRLTKSMAFDYLLHQVHLPVNHYLLSRTLDYLRELISSIPVYYCSFNLKRGIDLNVLSSFL